MVKRVTRCEHCGAICTIYVTENEDSRVEKCEVCIDEYNN